MHCMGIDLSRPNNNAGVCAGCISMFYEKPTGDDLDKVRSVSKNATKQDPFEASMGIYVFKRDVLVSLLMLW